MSTYLDYEDYLAEQDERGTIERDERREAAAYLDSLAELPEDENVLYTVWATYDKGETFKRIYIGHDRYMAVQMTNSSDARRDTYMKTYYYPTDVISVLNRKFNRALAEIDGFVFPAGERQFRLDLAR